MFSICIPLYNFDSYELLNALIEQGNKLGCPYEIIILDDASSQMYHHFKPLIDQPMVTYVRLDKNIGRAAIRNKFIHYASYHYLLFLDCDSKITSSDFLAKYYNYLTENPTTDVVYGGRIYPSEKPSRSHILRWNYGIHRESRSVEIRKQNPYQSFMTHNFCIRQEALKKIKFDEEIKTYGHEDTLFGYALKKNNSSLHHIDNPILDADKESNESFLQKVDMLAKTTAFLLHKYSSDKEFLYSIRVLAVWFKIKNIGLKKIAAIMFYMLMPPLRLFLQKFGSPLWLLDFYKLAAIDHAIKDFKNSTDYSRHNFKE